MIHFTVESLFAVEVNLVEGGRMARVLAEELYFHVEGDYLVELAAHRLHGRHV